MHVFTMLIWFISAQSLIWQSVSTIIINYISKCHVKCQNGTFIAVWLYFCLYDFNPAQIWDIVDKYDTGCTSGGGRDAVSVFYDAGLLFESNVASGSPYRQGAFWILHSWFNLFPSFFWSDSQ